MISVKPRLYSYFLIIQEEGPYISNWYIAEKTGQTKNRVAKDLRYARKYGWIIYKSLKCNVQINFMLTERGLYRMNRIGEKLKNLNERGKVA